MEIQDYHPLLITLLGGVAIYSIANYMSQNGIVITKEKQDKKDETLKKYNAIQDNKLKKETFPTSYMEFDDLTEFQKEKFEILESLEPWNLFLEAERREIGIKDIEWYAHICNNLGKHKKAAGYFEKLGLIPEAAQCYELDGDHWKSALLYLSLRRFGDVQRMLPFIELDVRSGIGPYRRNLLENKIKEHYKSRHNLK